MEESNAKKARTKKIEIRCSEDEFADFNALLKDSIYSSKSQLIRDIVLKKQYKVLAIDPDLINRNDLLLQKTRNIGHNFNQLLKLLHSKKLTYFTNDDINLMLKELNEIASLYRTIESYFSK